MVLGEQLRQLRRELALYDHDLVMDGVVGVFYCVHCHHSDLLPIRAYAREGILAMARHHYTACPVRIRRRGEEAASDGSAV